MRLPKILQIFIISLLAVSCCYSQEYREDENWLKGLGTEADNFTSLSYPLTKFTAEDLVQGKRRLKILRQSTPQSEWQGTYFTITGIGSSKLIWSTKGGFFKFYFYHYLKHFDYGTVSDSSGSVELLSEKNIRSTSGQKRTGRNNLIKTEIGEKHFLVPENRLQDFCDKAAGLGTGGDFEYYWMKEDEANKPVFGLPVLSSEYRRFLRLPVEAQVIGIGRKKVIPSEYTTKEVNYDDVYYPIVLNAGRNKDLKRNMNLFVEDLGEWIQITKVLSKTSLGRIIRNFEDDNKTERCWNNERGSGEIIPCKKIRIGMKAKTKASENF